MSTALVLMTIVSEANNGKLGDLPKSKILDTPSDRVAEVEGARERRSPQGQGLLRKEGPPTYAILSRNLVLL